MTDNVKLDLYDAIVSALEGISSIKHVLKYNSQETNDPDEIKRRYPQAWIEFSDIVWEPSLHKADNTDGTQEQKGSINMTIHVTSFSLSDDNDTFRTDLALINSVYRALTMLQGDNFSPLQRIGEVDDINQNNVRVWQITFSSGTVTEARVTSGQTAIEAGVVGVQILPREE